MSIGSKFALMALVLPICLIVAGLAIAYSVYSNPFLLALVAALPSADVFIWRELRSTLLARMLQVWTHYLKPIMDGVIGTVVGSAYYFPDSNAGLEPKLDWVSKYGKYGLVKLYPAKLVKLKLISKLLTAGDDFNSNLDKLLASSEASGFKVERYYAFDRWGLRKIPLEQLKMLDAKQSAEQKIVLDTLEKTQKEEILRLTQAWTNALLVSTQIVGILEKFSSENGIMPPKPVNPFSIAAIR